MIVNPLPWAVSSEVEFELEGTSTAEVDAFDEQSGAPVPVQRVRSLATLGGRHRRLVLAVDLPALGYRVYRLRPRLRRRRRAQPRWPPMPRGVKWSSRTPTCGSR